MLFGNESISHYTRPNISVWMAMAFQAGVINIGAFMACHRFVSHVTGFATFFGFEVSQHESLSAFGMLVVPLFFLLGSMLSGLLVDIRLKLHLRPKYYLSFGVMFFLNCLVFILGVMGFFGIFGEPLLFLHDYVLLVLLSLICGIQNGTLTTVSKSVVRTTHLTGITTDLGIGLVRFLNRHKIKDNVDNEVPANFMRIGIISFFCFGSVCGGFIFKYWQYGGFVLPCVTSGLLFFLMLYFQVLKPRRT